MKTQLSILGAMVFFIALSPNYNFADVHYVDAANLSPAAPYTNWMTAANNIQLAVDVSSDGDEVVVTNGFYATGGRDGFSVSIDKPITLRSVNGPFVTGIEGGSLRCIRIGNTSLLSGFTVRNSLGYTGIGIYGWNNAVATNCVVTGNSVGVVGGIFVSCVISSNGPSSDGLGGGANNATLDDCLVMGNTARFGGGAYQSTLTRCEVRDNLATYLLGDGGSGGGAYGSVLRNCKIMTNRASGGGMFGTYGGGGVAACTVYDSLVFQNSAWLNGGGGLGSTFLGCTIVSNSAPYGAGVAGGGLINSVAYFNDCHCPTGSGNYYMASIITNTLTQPAGGQDIFVNAAVGNFRLNTNSQGINSGNNVYAISSTDLDGNPRIVGGTVDVGAYECQNPEMLAFFSWLQSNNLPTTSETWYLDADSDGMNNWQEWRTWTIPTNAFSVFRMLPPLNTQTGLVVSWLSVPGKLYSVERCTSLATDPAFAVQTVGLSGQPDITTWIDTNLSTNNSLFYRAGVVGP